MSEGRSAYLFFYLFSISKSHQNAGDRSFQYDIIYFIPAKLLLAT